MAAHTFERILAIPDADAQRIRIAITLTLDNPTADDIFAFERALPELAAAALATAKKGVPQDLQEATP